MCSVCIRRLARLFVLNVQNRLLARKWENAIFGSILTTCSIVTSTRTSTVRCWLLGHTTNMAYGVSLRMPGLHEVEIHQSCDRVLRESSNCHNIGRDQSIVVLDTWPHY